VNARVLRLLADYFRRTLGAWALIAMAHIMQVTSFWAAHVERLPLLGAIIASLTYFVAFESPHAVLRTLPLSRADIALFRWWASVGAPGLIILACTSIAWLTSGDNGWARPSEQDVTLYALASWAVLAMLAAVPLPVRTNRESWTTFGIVWGLLGAGAFYGLPLAVPAPVLQVLIGCGLALSLAAYVRSWRGLTTTVPMPVLPWFEKLPASRTGKLRGWSLLAADVARSTALLSIVALIGASVARWLYPILDGPIPFVWLFVSAAAVAACLQTRRWMNAVRSLRILPIGAHRLTLILYALLIVPGTTACLVATAAWHLSPRLGLNVPAYMLIVFLFAPIALAPWQRQRHAAAAATNSVQQWAPLMQQAGWPLTAGALCSFGGPQLMPAWFLAFLIVIAIAFTIAGYVALLAGIRAPEGFERAAGPLGMAS
jgi:hypothetical protein